MIASLTSTSIVSRRVIVTRRIERSIILIVYVKKVPENLNPEARQMSSPGLQRDPRN